MTRHVLLDQHEHRELRVHTGHGREWGDATMAALTFPAEFRNIQAHYPIVFQRGDGGIQPFALLGLRQGENLFLDPKAPTGTGWDAWYVPLSIRRQPFLIGRDAAGGFVVHVDMDHPRAQAPDGQPLFLAHGGASDYLDEVGAMLGQLHEGIGQVGAFCAALEEAGLLESFVLDIEGSDGSEHRLGGFHTIHEERLRGLDADTLARLHEAGWLEPIYMALASLVHLRDLVERSRR